MAATHPISTLTLATGSGSVRAVDYCRRARRLRHELRHRPMRLHASLRRLSPTDPEGIIGSRPAAARAAPGPATRFAVEVASVMEGAILRYSARVALLRRAHGLKLDRFQANLIIAAVQHRARLERTGDSPSPRKRLWPMLAFAAAVQAVIVLGIRHLLW